VQSVIAIVVVGGLISAGLVDSITNR